MFDQILNFNLVSGPIVVVYFVAAAFIVYLLARKPDRRWLITAGIGVGSAVVVAIIALWIALGLLNVFGTPLSFVTMLWVVATFAALGLAIVNLWNSRWWRKVIAAVGIVVVLVAGTLGTNASIGLTPTLGSLLHVSTEQPANLPPLNGQRLAGPSQPLWQSWNPPADMPSTSHVGSVTIPGTKSGFPGRPGVVYLPPAAQVADPPDLPFVLLLNGQPGDPSVADIAPVLDRYAAANKGLAPIVLSADQLGDPAKNPLCINSPLGNVNTYIMNDVVSFARDHLNIFQDRTYWTIAGFSNGGECAISFGAQYPETWGNILDVSGELEPELSSPAETLREGFGGNQAAWDAAKPLNIIKSKHYTDTVAIFATGSEDEPYLSASKTLAKAAGEAGMTVTLTINPGSGHDINTVTNGYTQGFAVLYPRLGLSSGAPE